MLDHAQHVAGVAVLVVIPGHDLDEGRIEGDAGLGVEDGGGGTAAEVGGDHLLVGVGQDAGQVAGLGGGLHGGADLVVLGLLAQLDGQVDHGDVGGGHAEGHAGELAVQLRQYLADGLGGAGGGRDDVLQDAAATAPVLLGGAVDGLLSRGGGVDGGHEAALDAPVVMQHLGHGGQAVGGARGGGDDGLTGIAVVVDAIDEHGGGILGRGGLHHLLGAGLDVLLARGVVQEKAGALQDDVGADLVPLEVGGIGLGGQADALAIDDHGVAIDGDVAGEVTVDRVVLEHVGQVVRVQQVVDSDHLDAGEVLGDGTEGHAADAAETVDTDFDRHASTPE